MRVFITGVGAPSTDSLGREKSICKKGKRKMTLFINTKKQGYSPDQCGKTLTVGELIELLEGFDPESKIFLKNDNGYTFGSIRDSDIEEEWEDEEEKEE